MKIEVLGVGAGFYSELGNVSFLVWNDNESLAVLFECGSTVYPTLRKMELHGGRDIISKIADVYISHAHSDHIGSLDTLLSYRRFVLGQKTSVAGLDLDDYFRLCAMDGEQFVEESDVDTFRLYRTEHCPNMESWACLWANDILYSGDSGYSLLNQTDVEEVKVFIHEVSLHTAFFKNEEGETDFQIHVGIDELYKTSSPEVRAKTWLTHYAPQEKAELLKKAKEYGFAGLLEPGQVINF